MRGLTAVAVLMSTAACSTSVDAHADKLAAAYCKKIESCCQDRAPQDAGACLRGVVGALQPAAVKDANAKGALRYRGDVFDACLRKLDAANCTSLKDDTLDPLPECTAYLEPQLNPGAPCTLDAACKNGSCVGANPADGGVGACTPFAIEGASCGAAVCAAGLYCRASDVTCQRQKPQGNACSTNAECAQGGCNGRDLDAGTPGTCGLKGGPDSACFLPTGCSSAGPEAAAVLAAWLLLVRSVTARRRR